MEQPISGYLDSGYYAYKALIWHGIRHVPGSIWIFVPVFITACLMSFYITLLDNIDDKDDDSINTIKKFKNFMITYITTSLSTSIAYISLAIVTVNDLLIAFAVVTSGIQMTLDILRLAITIDEALVITYSMSGAIVAGVVLGLLDNTHIIDVIYVTYVTLSIVSVIILWFLQFIDRGIRLAIVTSSTVLMAATLTTNILVLQQIAENKAPIIVIFVFTGINYIIVFYATCKRDFHPKLAEAEMVPQ